MTTYHNIALYLFLIAFAVFQSTESGRVHSKASLRFKRMDADLDWKTEGIGGYVVRRRPIPEGIYEKDPTFLCRADLTGGVFRMGSLLIKDNQLQCIVAQDGGTGTKVYHTYDYLDHPDGATSWVPLPAGSEIPENAVHGGVITSGGAPVSVPICRGVRGTNVIIGDYNPDTKSCTVADGDDQADVQDMVEVLTLNIYGKIY